MELDNFAPIFGEPKIEWAGSGSGRVIRFLFHVFAPDSSNLFIHATDFHSSTWEAKRSVLQLEDMVCNLPLFFFFLKVKESLYLVSIEFLSKRKLYMTEILSIEFVLGIGTVLLLGIWQVLFGLSE